MLAVSSAQGHPVVSASGEFDMANAPTLRRCLMRLIDSGARHVLLNLSEVQFVDAAVLRVLADVRNRLVGVEGDLILIDVPALIRSLLRITALGEAFTIRPTLAEALTAVCAAPRCSTDLPNGTALPDCSDP